MEIKLENAGWKRLSKNVWERGGYTLLISSPILAVCYSPIGKRRIVQLFEAEHEPYN